MQTYDHKYAQHAPMMNSTAKRYNAHGGSGSAVGKPNGQLWSHVSASLDAASYIIALGLIDLITFGRPVYAEQQHEEKRDAARKQKTIVAGSPPASPTLGKQTNVFGPAFVAPRRSASDPGNGPPAWLPSAERRASWQRRSGSTDTYATESINDHYSRRNSHQHGARRLSQSYDGTVQHYQRKIFSKQVQRTMRLQPYVRVSIVFSFLLSFLFTTYLFALIITHGGVRPAVRAVYRPFL